MGTLRKLFTKPAKRPDGGECSIQVHERIGWDTLYSYLIYVPGWEPELVVAAVAAVAVTSYW